MPSRRIFLRRAVAGATSAWALWRTVPGRVPSGGTTVRADHGSAFFTNAELLLLAAIASLIVPSDDTPGAVEAGVVEKIALRVRDDTPLQALYRSGFRDIEARSAERFGQVFVRLNRAQQHDVLATLTSTEFFRVVREQTIEVFYASLIGWRSAGYPGPAQFHGYPNYDKPPQ